jgi:hypothetical protein
VRITVRNGAHHASTAATVKFIEQHHHTEPAGPGGDESNLPFGVEIVNGVAHKFIVDIHRQIIVHANGTDSVLSRAFADRA